MPVKPARAVLAVLLAAGALLGVPAGAFAQASEPPCPDGVVPRFQVSFPASDQLDIGQAAAITVTAVLDSRFTPASGIIALYGDDVPTPFATTPFTGYDYGGVTSYTGFGPHADKSIITAVVAWTQDGCSMERRFVLHAPTQQPTPRIYDIDSTEADKALYLRLSCPDKTGVQCRGNIKVQVAGLTLRAPYTAEAGKEQVVHLVHPLRRHGKVIDFYRRPARIVVTPEDSMPRVVRRRVG